ncbi:MAG: peptidylprolyl isomerase [Candidatus Omnitrophica bacterium]|nr:peptidylprolyl isomerase [Candidatus Omnitrophota bacterium]
MFSRKTIVFGSLIVGLIAGLFISDATAAPKLAAKVNGVSIKTETLDAAISNFIENQKAFGMDIKEEDKVELRKGVLDELISAELLYQESNKAKLGDLSKEAEAQFDSIKKGFDSDDDFKKVMKEKGITEKDIKADIKKGVYINAYLTGNVYNTITVTDAEKLAEYEANKDKLDIPEQVKASHILIRVGENATDAEKEEIRKKIDELRQRALSGEDFAELAKASSEDGSAPNGGDLGYFRRGMMVMPFEEAAFSLGIEEISGIVETQFGYHIIKVTDKQDPRKLNYVEVEPEITRFLTNKKKGEKVSEIVADLKKKAKIEIF